MTERQFDIAAPALVSASAKGRKEHRSIDRIPVRLAVSRRGRSAVIGRTRDLSLHGMFIETREPFEPGTVVPLDVELGHRSIVRVRAEVVRREADGMGLHFHDLDRDSARRLRRWVVEHTSAMGDRRQVEQLHDPQMRIAPIHAPDRILALLDEIRQSEASLVLISTREVMRERARVVEIDPDGFTLKSDEPFRVRADDEVYALLTLRWVSYSFAARISTVDGHKARCPLPVEIVFSERRTDVREAAPKGSTVRWPNPWCEGEFIELPLVDLSAHGLSFRAPLTTLLTPHTPLVGASVVIDGRARSLPKAEVRSLTPVGEGDARWLRVGVAIGVTPVVRERRTHERVRARTLLGRFAAVVKNGLSLMLYRGRERVKPSSGAHRVVVRGGPLPIVGILDRTSDGERSFSAPLVIVIPGFAGRKEQTSFLAGTLVEGFQRHHGDVAVVRIDGTNNMGESGKEPGFTGNGMHCMRYTISGVVDDILATLAWAKNNPFVQPTHIILVSVSMASIAARHVLTRPEGHDVSLWFSYTGAADAIDSAKNATGNIDFHAYYMRGEKVGTISLAGVLGDGDHFWHDLHQSGIGYLEHAKEEMARIGADVVWLMGRHDALMDPRRVEAIMRVPAAGGREIVEVDSGHVPKTGDEAVAQFVAITQRIWRHVHGSVIPRFTVPVGKLAVKAESEWKRVKRDVITDRADWWRKYLFDAKGLGFDILEYHPEYVEVMEVQAQRVIERFPATGDGAAPLVLELGAGTGNLTRRLLERGARVLATDIVPEALDALRAKAGSMEGLLETEVVDLDGSAWLALKRFIRGDLAGLLSLAERVPGVQHTTMATLLEHDGDELRAIIVGHEVDIEEFVNRCRLPETAVALLADLNLFSRVVRGLAAEGSARDSFRVLPPSVFEGGRGLSRADEGVDAVAISFVLSYLVHPEDTLSEAWRVLKPGGTLVASTLIPDSDSSRTYLDLVKRLETLPEAEIPAGRDPVATRLSLADSARRFVEHAAELYRLEEEGHFRFYSRSSFHSLFARRGFTRISIEQSFGDPPQALVVVCQKP